MSKAFDSIFQTVPELKTYDNVVKRIPQSIDAGKKMFSVCIQNSVKEKQLADKVSFVSSNPFLQNDMKYDYVEFAKTKMQQPRIEKIQHYPHFSLQLLPGSSDATFHETQSLTLSHSSSLISSKPFYSGIFVQCSIPPIKSTDTIFFGLLSSDLQTKYVSKISEGTSTIEESNKSFTISETTPTNFAICCNTKSIIFYTNGRTTHTVPLQNTNHSYCLYIEAENPDTKLLTTPYTITNIQVNKVVIK